MITVILKITLDPAIDANGRPDRTASVKQAEVYALSLTDDDHRRGIVTDVEVVAAFKGEAS